MLHITTSKSSSSSYLRMETKPTASHYEWAGQTSRCTLVGTIHVVECAYEVGVTQRVAEQANLVSRSVLQVPASACTTSESKTVRPSPSRPAEHQCKIS